MTFEKALQVLAGFQRFGMRPGLDTIQTLAARCGHPERSLRFIHVAGTNGKGSTCALLESIYRHGGYRTALYTSPHLVHFSERIQIDRVPIPEAELAALVEESLPATEGLEVTFFEFVTLLALRYFARRRPEIVIWETGLGGRWDATNLVTPLASVITNIGWDHQQWLGNTLPAIAGEKAGIIKPGIPVITGARLAAAANQEAESINAAWEVIHTEARRQGSPFVSVDNPATEFDLAGNPVVGLLGAHQRQNAAVALATVRTLQSSLPVPLPAVQRGLGDVQWAGRLQRVERGGSVWLLDGAHNLPGIEALTTALREEFQGQRFALVLGVLADKDWEDMCARLLPFASRVILAPVASTRTADPAALAAACRRVDPTLPVTTVGSVPEALDTVQHEPRVLITGSLYFLGEVLEKGDLHGGPGPGQRHLNEWKASPQESPR